MQSPFSQRRLSCPVVLAKMIGIAEAGKTSVTAMLAWAFSQVNYPASYLVDIDYSKRSIFTAGKYINSPWVLVELDERWHH